MYSICIRGHNIIFYYSTLIDNHELCVKSFVLNKQVNKFTVMYHITIEATS